MSAIRILHLSDLHLTKSTLVDQEIVLDAMFKDLATLKQADGPIDLVFFTGDLVGKGQYGDGVPAVVGSQLLDPLCEVLSIDRQRIFVAPGNHDKCMHDQGALLTGALDGLNDQEAVQKLYDDVDSLKAIARPFSAFYDACDNLSLPRPSDGQLHLTRTIGINGLNLNITVFNTAWRASGKSDDFDYGRLIIGRRQLDQALSDEAKADVRLALMHHGFDWLAHFERNEARNTILRTYSGVFHGHNHNTDVGSLASPAGHTLISNAGCLYQSREYFNGYSVVTYDHLNGAWGVKAREYYESRRSFDAAVRFSESGVANFSLASGKNRRLSFPTQEYIDAVREVVVPHLLSSAISDVAPQDLTDVFVEPPLSHLSERKMNAGDVGSYLSLAAILEDGSVPVFVGTKEGGKTTLMHYVCLQYTVGQIGNIPLFGVYINLAGMKPTRAELLRQIVSFSNSVVSRADFLSLLEGGRVALCLDDLDLANDTLVQVVADFCEEFPKCKYVFAQLEDDVNLTRSAAAPKLSGMRQNVVYIHSFKRKHTRELAAKWFGADASASPKVDVVLETLRRLNIPRTPFLISVLLWAHERNIEFDAVNQAEILDIFVDGILEKFTESKRRSNIDSRLKRHFLGSLAFHFYTNQIWSISEFELERFAVAYFGSRLLNAAAAPLVSELIEKGVLSRVQGEIWFKYDCLRAFFLSCWMEEDSEFLDSAFSIEHLHRLDQEVDYYTARNRSNVVALKKVLEILEARAKKIQLDINHDYFESISSKGSPINSDNREAIAAEFVGPPPAAEFREAELDRMDEETAFPISNSPTQREKNSFQSDGAKFVTALRIASTVLRNSELISDGALKVSAFKRIFELWGTVLNVTLLAVEIITDGASDAEIGLRQDSEGGSDETALREISSGAFSDFGPYIIKALAANAVSSVIKYYLATQKLDLVIQREMDGDQSTIVRFLGCSLMIDLASPNYLDEVQKLIEKLEKSRFSLELIFFKLSARYFMQATHPAEISKLQGMLADLHLRIERLDTAAGKMGMKGRFINDIERKKQNLTRNAKG